VHEKRSGEVETEGKRQELYLEATVLVWRGRLAKKTQTNSKATLGREKWAGSVNYELRFFILDRCVSSTTYLCTILIHKTHRAEHAELA
jgi:hypothetical protein